MLPSEPIKFTAFDIDASLHQYRTNLPHWRQGNVTYFVTFRLADSIPKEVFEEWQTEKREWLSERNVPLHPDKPVTLDVVPDSFRFEFEKEFNRKLNEYLDGGRGSCVLKKTEPRKLLIEQFERSRCEIGDYAVMPNHVHLLIKSIEDEELKASMQKLKGASSFEINRSLGQKGTLWHRDYFDHIVRTANHLERYQKYIAANPRKAGLKPNEYQAHEAQFECV